MAKLRRVLPCLLLMLSLYAGQDFLLPEHTSDYNAHHPSFINSFLHSHLPSCQLANLPSFRSSYPTPFLHPILSFFPSFSPLLLSFFFSSFISFLPSLPHIYLPIHRPRLGRSTAPAKAKIPNTQIQTKH